MLGSSVPGNSGREVSIRMGGRRIGQKDVSPGTFRREVARSSCPGWSLTGMGESRKSSDERTLKQNHILEPEISNSESKQKILKHLYRENAFGAETIGFFFPFAPVGFSCPFTACFLKHKSKFSSELQDGAGERMIHLFSAEEMLARRSAGKCPLPAGPWSPGQAKLIKAPFRIAITQKLCWGH